MAGQAATCPRCGRIMSNNVTNSNPLGRKCKCGAYVQWWIDKKTGKVQTGIR